jgi:hypothetical protein
LFDFFILAGSGYGEINILKETESEVNIVFGHGEGLFNQTKYKHAVSR